MSRDGYSDRPDDSATNPLGDIRRETTEARNLAIRTENALRTLTGEIRQVQRRFDGIERRSFFNSAVAYLLFAGLTFGGLALFFHAATERNRLDRSLHEERQAALEARIVSLEAELASYREAEREAWAFHELLASGRHDEALERFPTVQGRLRDQATVELFRGELERYRHRLAEEAWLAGRGHASAGEWTEARDALLRSHALATVTPYGTERAWWLAEALHGLRDYRGAATWYEEALSSETLPRRDAAIAWFRLAESLERSGQREAAAEAWESFLRRFSTHGWRATAQQRLSALRTRMAAEQSPE